MGLVVTVTVCSLWLPRNLNSIIYVKKENYFPQYDKSICFSPGEKFNEKMYVGEIIIGQTILGFTLSLLAATFFVC